MNILFITHHYLSSNGGGSFASRAYINAFAEIADEMTLLYPIKEGENLFPGINKKVKTIPVEYNIPKWRKVFDLICGRVHRYYKVAPKFIKSKDYDVVVFDNSKTSFRLIDFAHKYGKKTIVIHHNFEYEYVRDNSKGLLRFVGLFWTKKYEKEATCKSDLNLTLTKQDLHLLCNEFRNGNRDNFKVLGTFEYKPFVGCRINELEPGKINFVITGNLGARQTEQSLIPWIQNYYPLIKDVFPNSVVTIAGKNPSERLRQICQTAQIQLIPSPKSMDPIMEKASYYICPIHLGGGIKLRVMDGLKWGVPVIAHVVSARGYDSFIERGCVISYTDKKGFYEALQQLKKINFHKNDIQDLYRLLFSYESGVKRVRNVLAILH